MNFVMQNANSPMIDDLTIPPVVQIPWTAEQERFGGWWGLTRRTGMFAVAGLAPVALYAMKFQHWSASFSEQMVISAAILLAAIIGGWVCEFLLRARAPWSVVAILHFVASAIGVVAIGQVANLVREFPVAGFPTLRSLLMLAPLSILGGLFLALAWCVVLGPASVMAVKFAVGSLYEDFPLHLPPQPLDAELPAGKGGKA